LNSHCEACATLFLCRRRSTLGQIRGDGIIQEQVVELHAARRFLKTMQTPKRTFQIANDSLQAKKLVSIKFEFLYVKALCPLVGFSPSSCSSSTGRMSSSRRFDHSHHTPNNFQCQPMRTKPHLVHQHSYGTATLKSHQERMTVMQQCTSDSARGQSQIRRQMQCSRALTTSFCQSSTCDTALIQTK